MRIKHPCGPLGTHYRRTLC